MVQQKAFRDDLRCDFDQKRVSIVLGTGVSAALCGNQKTATWKGLLNAGLDWYASGNPSMSVNVDHFRAVLNGSPTTEMLVAIAQFVGGQFRKAGTGEYQSWLNRTIATLTAAEDNALANALPQVDRVMTTNYDELWNASYEREPITWTTKNAHDKFMIDPAKYVFHLHGHYSESRSVILTGEDYGRLAEDASSPELIRVVARQSSLVLIGYGAGLDDPNFSTLVDWLYQKQSTYVRRHYVLVTDDQLSTFTDHHFASRLTPVSYGPSHDCLGPFLKEVAPRSEPPPHAVKQRQCSHPKTLPPNQTRSVLPEKSTGFHIAPSWYKRSLDQTSDNFADVPVRLHDAAPDGSQFAILLPSGETPRDIHDPTFWDQGPGLKRRITERWCLMNRGKNFSGYVFEMRAKGQKKIRIYCDDYDRYLTEEFEMERKHDLGGHQKYLM